MSLSDELTQRYYETTAARGHTPDRAYYDRAAPALLRRLGSWLPIDRATPCLDIACGCGELVHALEQQGFRDVSGIDLSEQNIAQGRPFVSSPLRVGDAVDHLASVPEASLGLITALNFVEHLPKDRARTFFDAAARALRSGGTLVMMVPNAMSPFGASTRYWDLTHEWAFTPNNFRQLAALTRFSPQIDFRECGPIPHGLVSSVRYGLWQLLRAGIAAWFLVEVGSPRERVYSMDMLVRMHKP